MSDAINLEWIGARLLTIQAEQRTLQSEASLVRTTLAEVLRLLSERIGNFEALMVARIEQVDAKLDSIEAQVRAGFERLEGK